MERLRGAAGSSVEVRSHTQHPLALDGMCEARLLAGNAALGVLQHPGDAVGSQEGAEAQLPGAPRAQIVRHALVTDRDAARGVSPALALRWIADDGAVQPPGRHRQGKVSRELRVGERVEQAARAFDLAVADVLLDSQEGRPGRRGDVAAAAWPAFLTVQEYVGHGQVESARRLLDAFTDAELSRHLALTMAAGWLYGTVIGDPSKGERWRHAACSVAVGYECMPDDLGSWRAWQLGLRAFLAPDGVTGMLEDAESSVACEQPSFAHAVESQRVLGVATYLNGAPRRASHAFHELLRDSADPATCSYALAFLSLMAADEGSWDDARELDRRALELTPGMTLDVSPGMYMALPMLLAHARVLAQRGDPDWHEQVRACEHYLAHMVPQVPWRIMLICVVLGEICVQRGQLDEADRWAAL